jgi:hypothetical protein
VSPQSAPTYARAWAIARRQKLLAQIASGVLGVAPVLLGAAILYRGCVEGGDPPFGFFLYLAVFGGLACGGTLLAVVTSLAANALRLFWFRCPRCGKRFARPMFEGPACQHCGLPAGAERDTPELRR